eukprot:4013593-Lingulodinium_polyedra.AAC.1
MAPPTCTGHTTRHKHLPLLLARVQFPVFRYAFRIQPNRLAPPRPRHMPAHTSRAAPSTPGPCPLKTAL